MFSFRLTVWSAVDWNAIVSFQVVKQLEIILALSMANRENAGGKTNVLILGRGGKLTNDVLDLVGTDPTSPCYDVTCKRVCDAPPLPPPPLAPAYPSEPSFPPFFGGASGRVRTQPQP